MSDEKWYTNLSKANLPGKHVHVTFSNGSMDGCLSLNGEIPYWADDDDMESVQILEQNDDKTWALATGVESVSLVWDEREWEQIDVEEAEKHDAIVVNGCLLHVTGVGTDLLFVKEQEAPIYLSNVTCALRCKSIPKKPGFYESDSEDVFYLANDNEWWMIEDDGVAHLTLPPTAFLPMTPIHFELGEADYE